MGFFFLLGDADGRFRVIGFNFEMEEQTAEQRQEQVADQHNAEQQAGRVDRCGNHQQQAKDQQLRVVTISALFVQLHELEHDKKLTDHQHRTRVIAAQRCAEE